MLTSLHLDLCLALTRREIELRYKGSFGGLAWYVIQTLCLVGVYSFVFGSIFRTRWTEAGREPTSFVMALFLGLLVFNFFSETLSKSATVIVSNRSYVRKIIFPLEILPVVVMGAAAFNMVIGFAVFLAAALVTGISITWTALWVPVILLPFMLLLLGILWLVSSLGTYIRDMSPIIGLATMVVMFVSPVFYPSEVLPEALRPLIVYNPISLPIEMIRGAVLFDKSPDLVPYFAYFACGLLCSWLGLRWFRFTKKGFADVL